MATDPHIIAETCTYASGLGAAPTPYRKPIGALREAVGALLAHLPHLSPFEADCVELYYLHGKTQTEVAAILRHTQPTVCYALQRAAWRMSLMQVVPPGMEEEIREALALFLPEDYVVAITAYYAHRSQILAAESLGVDQSWIRGRLLRGLSTLQANAPLDPVAAEVAGLLSHMVANPNQAPERSPNRKPYTRYVE